MSQHTLYCGLRDPKREGWTHLPLIKIKPLDLQPCLAAWEECSDVIVTSQTTVELLTPHVNWENKRLFAVGKKTAAHLPTPHVAEEETAEGVAALLERFSFEGRTACWPHSALSRPVLTNYLSSRGVSFRSFPIYSTEAVRPEVLPDLGEFDRVRFMSPSTVDAFFAIWPEWPSHLKWETIGPITECAIRDRLAL